MSIVGGLLMAGLLIVQGPDIVPAIVGDSYASGTGAGEYSDDLCLRSENSAISRAAGFFETDAVNAACNGAWVNDLTSARVIARTRTDIVPEQSAADLAAYHEALLQCGEDMAGASTSLELVAGEDGTAVHCTVTLEPQIATAAGATDIFVVIGGNDIGFVPVASACLIQEAEEACRRAVDESSEALDGALEAQREAVIALRAASPDARIHLVPYPRLLAEESGRFVGSYDVAAEVSVLQGRWESELERMADELDIACVKTVGPIWAGHGIGAEGSWIHTTGDIGELLHPTEDGWNATGAALIAHLGATLLP